MSRRNFRAGYELPVAIVDVAVNFLDHRLLELLSIILPHCLVKVHDVSNHFCVECNGVAHTVLKAEVFVVALGEEIVVVNRR